MVSMNEKDIEIALKLIPEERMKELSKSELIVLLRGEQKLRTYFQEIAEKQVELSLELKDKIITIEGKLVKIKHYLFGKRSEKEERPNPKEKKPRKKREDPVKLPSKRYPDARVVTQEVILEKLPTCSCCNSTMKDSGMTEDSEFLTIIPKQFVIVLQKRRKYRCDKCHSQIVTAPVPPRIVPGSTYGDGIIIDSSASKFCDLIPMERYVQMASRQGFSGLPPQSLIEGSHHLAAYIKPAYLLLLAEICEEEGALSADETPHRMLEGDEKSNWYLWGFSSKKTCYFEHHNTRAGSVATNILSKAKCFALLTDVYSGYGKSVKEVNEERKKNGLAPIKQAFCNAHSRRKLKQSSIFPESKYYVDRYKEIYALEDKFKETSDMIYREQMKPIFEDLKTRAIQEVNYFSSKSDFAEALNYFIKNYDGLTLFTDFADTEIDNNRQERLLRNPVIGRKTWYGTHSIRGAETAAILFSIIESCRLNKKNPRQYLEQLVSDLHEKKPIVTPRNFIERKATPPQTPQSSAPPD
jgi:transposase